MSEMDRQYWDSRAHRYGPLAVGYSDPLLYQYEEKLRWAAFRRVQPLKPSMQVLDVGCGVGQWSVRLARLGCRVIGIDISSKMIQMAIQHPLVTYQVGAVQDLDLPPAFFDLIISITVLQHITAPVAFEQTIEHLARLLKEDGHIVILEYSPRQIEKTSSPPPYMCYRSHQEWLQIWTHRGFELIRETGVRFWGHRFYAPVIRRLAKIARGWCVVEANGQVRGVVGQMMEWLSLHIDLLLAQMPLIGKTSDVNCMVFGKQK